MNALDILTAARQLIADPEHWCRDVSARNIDGINCGSMSKKAVQWCAMGATAMTAKDAKDVELEVSADKILNQSAKELYGDSIIGVNDRMGHAAVMKCFDFAIKSLRAPDDQASAPDVFVSCWHVQEDPSQPS